jgi:hypothetical protein
MNTVNEIIRGMIIAQAAFVAGISLITLIAYRKRPLIAHISAVATSYLILTLIVAYGLFMETYLKLSVRGVLALIAFGLGDYALLKILNDKRNHRIKK